jgi:hypothetical protein
MIDWTNLEGRLKRAGLPVIGVFQEDVNVSNP